MDEKQKKTLRPGARVTWKSSAGTIAGTIRTKIQEPCDIRGHHVAASPEHPEYLVRSDKTGAEAAHTADALEPR